MLKKTVTYIMILIALIIGASCTIPLTLFIAKMSLTDDPIIWGIACGILSVLIPPVGYKAIRPNLGRVYEEKPLFGELSIRIYFFSMICGVSSFLLYMSISSFESYWFTR